jgi:hypothetical protein
MATASAKTTAKNNNKLLTICTNESDYLLINDDFLEVIAVQVGHRSAIYRA